MVCGMARQDSPEAIVLTRRVSAEAILDNRVDLGGYPYRHLVVVGLRRLGLDRVSSVIAAVEVLDRFGWELVNVAELGGYVCAFLRRR